MFCNRCGKEIDYNATVCNECLEQERKARENNIPPATPPYPAKEKEGSIMTGFGKALTGIILGIVGLSVSICAMILGVAFTVGSQDPAMMLTQAEIEALLSAAITMILITVGLIIASAILGIKSIIKAVKEKKAKRKFPIPSLVLGVGSLECVLCACFFLLYALVCVIIPLCL